MTYDSDPGEAIRALDQVASRPPAVDLLKAGASRTKGPEVHGAGSFRACCTKLESAIGSHRTLLAREQKRRQNLEGLLGTIMVVVSAGPPVFLMGITQPVSWLFLGVNAVFAGVVTLMLAAAHRVLAAHDMAHLGRLDALRRVLERLGQAAEPVARCVLRVDLAAASDAPPFSTEYVYMRGKTKLGDALLRIGRDAKEPLTRHRHRWAEVSFELLCGSPVRLVLADEVVYRGGLEERRTSGLSGHFTPNPQAWRLDALPEAFDVGPLRVVRRELAGRTSLAFRCGVQAVEDIAGALEALVAALEPRA